MVEALDGADRLQTDAYWLEVCVTDADDLQLLHKPFFHQAFDTVPTQRRVPGSQLAS